MMAYMYMSMYCICKRVSCFAARTVVKSAVLENYGQLSSVRQKRKLYVM